MKRRRSKEEIISGTLVKSKGLRARVDAHCVSCVSCVYDETVPGTWRQQVEDCQVILCALWEVRPRSSGSKVLIPTLDHSVTPVGGEEPAKCSKTVVQIAC